MVERGLEPWQHVQRQVFGIGSRVSDRLPFFVQFLRQLQRLIGSEAELLVRFALKRRQVEELRRDIPFILMSHVRNRRRFPLDPGGFFFCDFFALDARSRLFVLCRRVEPQGLKIAEGRNKNISLDEMRSMGGEGMPIYVYDLQSCIPGSEEKHQALEDKFKQAGCTTYFPSRYKPNKFTVHASGHASAGDVAKLCKIVSEKSERPTMVVPIHGDPGQRRNVMKIAQDNGLTACIVPNMAEMKAFDRYTSWDEGGKTEEWIGVNDLNNDFRRPYFMYDKVEMDLETKQKIKTATYKYKKAPRKPKEETNNVAAVEIAKRKRSR